MKKMMSGLVAVIVAAAALSSAQAQDSGFYTWVQFHRVHLRNGNFLDGTLVSKTDRSVTLRQPWGEILIRSDQIDRVELVKMKSFNDPEQIIQRKAKSTPQGPTEIITTPSSSSKPLPSDLTDSKDPVPGSIPQAVVLAVDQAITVWRSSTTNEQVDLGETLKAIGPDAVPYFEFLLEKRQQSTPLKPVARAFASLNEDKFLTFAARMMDSQSLEIREAAIEGLAKTTSPRRLPIVLKAAEDTFPAIGTAATQILMDAAKEDGEKNDLVDMIGSRIRAAKNNTAMAVALARIGGPRARELLWELVGDNNETNRLTGLHGLGIMADPEDGPRMVSVLHDSSETIKKGACIALGKIKYTGAVADLITLLSDPNEGLHQNARWALQETTRLAIGNTDDAWKEWWETVGSKEPSFRH